MPKELALSVEGIRPTELVAWFALHDDDYDLEILSNILRLIRADDGFRTDFDGRMDQLQAEADVMTRGEDGYLGTIPEGADPRAIETIAVEIFRTLESEGYAAGAVDVLRRSGHEAWVNEVGHIAVDPKGFSL